MFYGLVNVAVEVVVIVAVVIVAAVDDGDAVFLEVFWGQDLEKWPRCLQFQH